MKDNVNILYITTLYEKAKEYFLNEFSKNTNTPHLHLEEKFNLYFDGMELTSSNSTINEDDFWKVIKHELACEVTYLKYDELGLSVNDIYDMEEFEGDWYFKDDLSEFITKNIDTYLQHLDKFEGDEKEVKQNLYEIIELYCNENNEYIENYINEDILKQLNEDTSFNKHRKR